MRTLVPVRGLHWTVNAKPAAELKGGFSRLSSAQTGVLRTERRHLNTAPKGHTTTVSLEECQTAEGGTVALVSDMTNVCCLLPPGILPQFLVFSLCFIQHNYKYAKNSSLQSRICPLRRSPVDFTQQTCSVNARAPLCLQPVFWINACKNPPTVTIRIHVACGMWHVLLLCTHRVCKGNR